MVSSFPELPAKSVDLAAINLTELVNGMLNTALKGSKKFFSLLSITSYSSYAFHKVSIVVYNISNLKNIDPTKFPMRYCYCLNNRTNDLTDFTALLVDIVGNSTDSLKEIFKSTSIVSVSQGNDTDCIYICVMSGRTGRNLSDLWEAIEKSPFINYTFSGNVSDLLGKCILNVTRREAELLMNKKPLWNQLPAEMRWDLTFRWLLKTFSFRRPCQKCDPVIFCNNICTTIEMVLLFFRTFGGCFFVFKLIFLLLYASLVILGSEAVYKSANDNDISLSNLYFIFIFPKHISATKIPRWPQTGDWKGKEMPFTQDPTIQKSVRCPQAMKKGTSMTTSYITAQKINPCVMELCKFFQQCLCARDRSYSRDEAMRYCIENYSWFLKNATYICEKVKRAAHSRSK
uniref:HHLA1 neighbor of OC90 n=1 Tax=Podarcis muralis TaxID=64176 RepID=A0A670JQH7_PODMU